MSKLKRYTCVDRQSGLALVDDGYVTGMLGPQACREDPEGFWVKASDVEKLEAELATYRSSSSVINTTITVDGGDVAEKLEAMVRDTVVSYLSDAEARSIPESDIRKHMQAYDPGMGTSSERYALMCEEVAKQSKNSLFRSGAKICAGVIRDSVDRPQAEDLEAFNWAAVQVATGQGLDQIGAKLNFGQRALGESDQAYRVRLLGYYTKPAQTTDPETFAREYLISPPKLDTEADKRFVNAVGAGALDMVGDRYGVKRGRSRFERENDTAYRARILREIQKVAATKAD
jgi:hypothetical protein